MRLPLRAPGAPCLALAVSLTYGAVAHAQDDESLRPVGHPTRVASGTFVLDARTFAVARVGDRAVIAFVQATEARVRGSVRTAMLHATATHDLARDGADGTIAPAGSAVALTWDGTRGAVVYTVSRPHRGEAPGTHRQRVGSTERALDDPLGPSALTAADVMLQPIDAHGAAVGAPLRVFEENARVYQVAVATDGDGWIVAWTGALSRDDEVQGTVRWARVGPRGLVRAMASDTGFVGQVGDVLRVVPANGAHARAVIVWSGEPCDAREREPAWQAPAPEPDPPRVRSRAQHPPHEHAGPPIVCEPRRLLTVVTRADGTSSALVRGPTLATDAFAVIDAGTDAPRVLAGGPDRAHPALVAYALAGDGSFGAAVTLVAAAPRTDTPAEGNALPEATPALEVTPSRVPPPMPPDAAQILATPQALDATVTPQSIRVIAISPTRHRVALATIPRQASAGDPALQLWAPGVALSQGVVAPGPTPWWFVRSGSYPGGPVAYVDDGAAPFPAAGIEPTWLGDERFRQHLLRARAARAAYTSAENLYGPLAESADPANAARLSGLIAGLRRLRNVWESACGPLGERARFLARHGADPTVIELVREQCELPTDPPTIGPQ